MHSIFAAAQSNDLQVAKSPNKSIAELYNSAWVYLQTKAPHALPLKTLGDLKESAETTMTAKAEEKKKEIEAAKKRAAQAEGKCLDLILLPRYPRTRSYLPGCSNLVSYHCIYQSSLYANRSSS